LKGHDFSRAAKGPQKSPGFSPCGCQLPSLPEHLKTAG
jgi:hypothetical protein